MLEPRPSQQTDPEKLNTDESMRLIADRLRTDLLAQIGTDYVYDGAWLGVIANSLGQKLVLEGLLNECPIVLERHKLSADQCKLLEKDQSLIAVVGNHGFRVNRETQTDGSFCLIIYFYDRTNVMKQPN